MCLSLPGQDLTQIWILNLRVSSNLIMITYGNVKFRCAIDLDRRLYITRVIADLLPPLRLESFDVVMQTTNRYLITIKHIYVNLYVFYKLLNIRFSVHLRYAYYYQNILYPTISQQGRNFNSEQRILSKESSVNLSFTQVERFFHSSHYCCSQH